MKSHTTIKQNEKTTTGIQIPDEVIEALGAGRKPPVKLTVNGYSYRSTVATVDGTFMVGLNANHRAASGLRGGDEIDVERSRPGAADGQYSGRSGSGIRSRAKGQANLRQAVEQHEGLPRRAGHGRQGR